MSIIYRCREASAVVKVNHYILIVGPRDKLRCKLWICIENCTTFSIGQETPTLMNMLFSQLITCWTCKSFPWKQSNGFQRQVIQGTKLGFSSTWARVDLSKCVYVMCPNRVNLLRIGNLLGPKLRPSLDKMQWNCTTTKMHTTAL